MRLIITENQLKDIVKSRFTNQEIKEEGDAAAAAPVAGTSSDGDTKTGMSKWESGVTRGPANQIAVTRWLDIAGVTPARGKANPLWEQASGGAFPGGAAGVTGGSLVKILRPDGKVMYAPFNTEIIGVFDSSSMDGDKFKNSLKNLLSKENGGFGNKQTQEWIPTNWSKIIKLDSVSTFKTPDNKIYRAILRHPKLDEFDKKNATWEDFYALDPDPFGWKFNGYFTDQGTAFNGVKQVEPEKSWWDEWKYWILAGASILAVIVLPGIGGILLSIGLDLAASAMQYAEGDKIGAGVSFVLAFLPVIGKAIPALKVSEEVATKLAKQFAPLKTEAEIIAAVKALPQQERYLMQKLLAEDPRRLTTLIEKEMFGRVTQTNATEIVTKINELIKTKVLDKVKAEKLFKSLGLKRFGFDIVATIGVSGAGVIIQAIQEPSAVEKKQEMTNRAMDSKAEPEGYPQEEMVLVDGVWEPKE
jgi:hypothetical protein